MNDPVRLDPGATQSKIFYGWYIVGVGILVHIAGTFAFSSTLSIFLKPITEELGVTRGAFSLIRTFEIGVAALIVPLLGSWIDRYGGRGILARRSHGRRGTVAFKSSAEFLAVRASPLLARDRRRSASWLLGDQCHD